MKKGWYHETCMDGTNRIFWFDPKKSNSAGDERDFKGPFKRFGDAKQDAKEYWRTLKTTAQIEIDRINNIKWPGEPLGERED